MERRTAFRRTRATLGEEVCPQIASIIGRHPYLEDELAIIRTTTHHLRQALAALLVLHTTQPTKCPMCAKKLPEHNDKCHLGRLLGEVG